MKSAKRKTKTATAFAFVDPALATLRTKVPPGAEWIHEIKFDGYRAQAHIHRRSVKVFTRRGYDWTPSFQSIADDLSRTRATSLVLDGEIVVLDTEGRSDFRLLQQDLAQGRTDRLTYFAFDLLELNGLDYREKPLVDRKARLHKLMEVFDGSRIRYSNHLETDSASLLAHACAIRVEGIVSKRKDSPYRSGRTETWIKVKCNKSDTFPIIAFVEKLGAKPRRIASLYLGQRKDGQLIYAGKAQTGFTNAQLYEIRERLNPFIRKTTPLDVPIKKPKATWVEPTVEAEVQYSGFTSDGLLRAPVFKGLREDLAPAAKKTARAKRSSSRIAVPKENILQLLPDAVVPSKDELAAYWKKLAKRALPFLANRPLKLVRSVKGTTFYHKGALPSIPRSVHQLKIKKREGGEGTRVWIDDLAGLLGLLDMDAIELHPWNATVDDIERADTMVFDLDPGVGIAWEFVRDSALALKLILDDEGFTSWPKLTGGKGVHLMVPLDTPMKHDEAHRLSRQLANRLVKLAPKQYTLSANFAARRGRLFIDYLRNGRGTTAVGTYSPRAREGFPIAAPVNWNQIEDGARPDEFSMFRPPRSRAR
jgi:bifunctional non-homologous end joining protein LigD